MKDYGHNLWALTSFFNPAGFRRRLGNYRIFRERLQAPLVAVELSFDGVFELKDDDADIVIRVCDGDVMFQKERLLNLALDAVPAGCDAVAWVDCDVLFERPDWPVLAQRQLDSDVLVHLFQERVDLARDADLARFPSCDGRVVAVSSMYRIRTLGAHAEDVIIPGSVGLRKTANGLAWAARREILVKHGFYEACVMGSGDQALVCAALGLWDHYASDRAFSDVRTRHYVNWAKPFHNTVRKRMNYILGRIYHLWHGELENRRYSTRHLDFARFDFDPDTDIRLSPSGCWKWSSDKTDMHRFVNDYFRSRCEDG